jgi:hypothetical protein
VRRLARTQQLPAELIAVLDGPLADAVAVAADYAGDAITATTRAAYLGDWAEFAAWCRTQQVDPTALPIHPVLVAAYLATLAEKIGRSALRRRVLFTSTCFSSAAAMVATDVLFLKPLTSSICRLTMKAHLHNPIYSSSRND